MKTSCISHLSKEPIIIIRQSYNKICKNNVVSSALISFFEYWHNIKLEMQIKNKTANDVAEAHGDGRNHDETLYQFHNYTELSNGIMNIGGETKVRLSIKELQQLGIITLHRNPNPRYKFDNTIHYLFHPEVLQSLVDSLKITGRPLKFKESYLENKGWSGENEVPSDENKGTIPEITTKITTEITKDKRLCSSQQKTLDELDNSFEIFWEAYPRKVQRKDALKAWDKNSKNLEVILKDIKDRLASGEWRDKKFIPYPTTYLNGERWKDEIIHIDDSSQRDQRASKPWWMEKVL